MSAVIGLFGEDRDAEKAFLKAEKIFAGRTGLIRVAPWETGDQTGRGENHRGLRAAMAADQVMDSATIGMVSLSSGDRFNRDPWDEEFGLDFDPHSGQPQNDKREDNPVIIRGDHELFALQTADEVEQVLSQLKFQGGEIKMVRNAIRNNGSVILIRAGEDAINRAGQVLRDNGASKVFTR